MMCTKTSFHHCRHIQIQIETKKKKEIALLVNLVVQLWLLRAKCKDADDILIIIVLLSTIAVAFWEPKVQSLAKPHQKCSL